MTLFLRAFVTPGPIVRGWLLAALLVSAPQATLVAASWRGW